MISNYDELEMSYFKPTRIPLLKYSNLVEGVTAAIFIPLVFSLVKYIDYYTDSAIILFLSSGLTWLTVWVIRKSIVNIYIHSYQDKIIYV